VMLALASGNGDFAESDVWLFGARTAAIAAALTDARHRVSRGSDSEPAFQRQQERGGFHEWDATGKRAAFARCVQQIGAEHRGRPARRG
jgi:hypothetical protein